MSDLIRKNKNLWEQRYKSEAQRLTEKVKDRIYGDEYEQFSEFVKDFEEIKEQYDSATKDGDSIEKWKHFNEISEHLYRLAGETITTKINKNLHHEKQLMEQKMLMQQEELQHQQKLMLDEKEMLKNKIEFLEKQNTKITALEDSHKTRALQYKNEHDRLYEKHRQLSNEH